MNAPHTHAVVLFGHGSRDPLWHLPMERVATLLRAQHGDWNVRCAYLELSQPDLPTVCQELAAAGIQSISVLPLFLGVGRHAREDLPLLLQAEQARYPHIAFSLKPAVGEDPRLLQLLAQIAAE